jgi:hypothetical protein
MEEENAARDLMVCRGERRGVRGERCENRKKPKLISFLSRCILHSNVHCRISWEMKRKRRLTRFAIYSFLFFTLFGIYFIPSEYISYTRNIFYPLSFPTPFFTSLFPFIYLFYLE